MLPLTRELAVLAGHLWCRSLLNLRAERNEFLLLHRFHERKLIKPDRPESNQKQFSLASGMPGDGDEEDVSGHQVDGARKKKVPCKKKFEFFYCSVTFLKTLSQNVPTLSHFLIYRVAAVTASHFLVPYFTGKLHGRFSV